jgi:4-amino-4-deoxy-L-arabinose transferase-like glycosyltransferase
LETFPTLDNFLATTSVQIPLFSFLANLLLTALLAAVLGKVYIRFGNSLSNRRHFARNFVLLAMTVMLIITIVKSSLALSLGLVGALSIVRYRAAIKEPEELGYLFVAITLGLGMGANQTIITVIAFLIIVAIIWVRSLFRRDEESPNLHLTVSSGERKVALEDIINALR